MKNPLDNFIGISAPIKAVRAELEEAARSDAKVLLTGESGVGKEVASRVIHQLSRRAHLPFVAINCVGIPESLLESELFGHVRGSFTGAYRDRMGVLERAHRGTLLMDEVCEMGLRMQGLLLRFLETGDIQPVGSDRPPAGLDVRIIAATNRDPFELVRSKSFREDLYYRLNVIDIMIPPLRERREDIPIPVRALRARVQRSARDAGSVARPGRARVAHRARLARQRAAVAEHRRADARPVPWSGRDRGRLVKPQGAGARAGGARDGGARDGGRSASGRPSTPCTTGW